MLNSRFCLLFLDLGASAPLSLSFSAPLLLRLDNSPTAVNHPVGPAVKTSCRVTGCTGGAAGGLLARVTSSEQTDEGESCFDSRKDRVCMCVS